MHEKRKSDSDLWCVGTFVWKTKAFPVTTSKLELKSHENAMHSFQSVPLCKASDFKVLYKKWAVG